MTTFKESYPNLDKILNQNDIKKIFGGLSKRDASILVKTSPKWEEFMNGLERDIIQANLNYRSAVQAFFDPYQVTIQEMVVEVNRKRQQLKKEEEQQKAIDLVKELLAQQGLGNMDIASGLEFLSQRNQNENPSSQQTLNYSDLKKGMLIRKGKEGLQELLENDLFAIVDNSSTEHSIPYLIAGRCELLEQNGKLVLTMF